MFSVVSRALARPKRAQTQCLRLVLRDLICKSTRFAFAKIKTFDGAIYRRIKLFSDCIGRIQTSKAFALLRRSPSKMRKSSSVLQVPRLFSPESVKTQSPSTKNKETPPLRQSAMSPSKALQLRNSSDGRLSSRLTNDYKPLLSTKRERGKMESPRPSTRMRTSRASVEKKPVRTRGMRKSADAAIARSVTPEPVI
jgi:hypothetical protein